jgi:beta-carotene hydroxylase
VERAIPLPRFRNLSVDLVRLTRTQLIVSLCTPFVWSGLYFALAIAGYWPAALFCLAALSFVTYGSVSHDLVHGNIGLEKNVNSLLLTLIELLALRSGHAYRIAHLHHHRRFPHDDDIEGATARMSLGRTLLEGTVFQIRIFAWALPRAGNDRGLIVLEGAICALVVLLAIGLMPWTRVPIVYVATMIMGAWVIPLVTSYIPHIRDGEDELHRTRRFRGKVASVLALEHLYHLEHHLYPMVPHHHWPALARRLDPYLDAAGVVPVKLWF